MATKGWPASREFMNRFLVPDLIPAGEGELRAVFIGESPHRDEVKPEKTRDRTPFRGVAGREWWSELSRFLAEPLPREVPDREKLLDVCDELGVGVMNAVQYPIDSKIKLHQGEKASPVEQLGFDKSSGPTSYKKIYRESGSHGEVGTAIQDLAKRLQKLEDRRPRIVCLGNDSRWFTEKALSCLPEDSPLREQELLTIPHPSSWWRNASYRARAVVLLNELLSGGKSRKTRPGEAPGRVRSKDLR